MCVLFSFFTPLLYLSHSLTHSHTGQSWDLSLKSVDVDLIPLQSVGCVFNQKNVWANIQSEDHPADLNWYVCVSVCKNLCLKWIHVCICELAFIASFTHTHTQEPKQQEDVEAPVQHKDRQEECDE
jgi:hypothetical protein